jgi:hypothetical protein
MPAMPRQMQSLPVDKRGYPVPWFVEWRNGEPEFRAMDRNKFVRAINQRLCWVCGQKLYEEMVFVVGPMCALNLISSEPPSHRQCAQFSARACPFLSRPHMVRREDEEINSTKAKANSAGIMVERNPGVTLLWFTKSFELLRIPPNPEQGVGAGHLFKMGRPFMVEWYAKGRPATRVEVLESIGSGVPLLYEANRKQGIDEAVGREEIERRMNATMRLVPKL